MTGTWASQNLPALGTVAPRGGHPPGAFESARIELAAPLVPADTSRSRFRSDSELMLVNSGPGHPVRVRSTLLDVAWRAARLTAGGLPSGVRS